MVAAVEELRAGTFVGERIGGVHIDFWQSWMDLGDRLPDVVRGLDRPMFALSGDYDWNVPPAETEAWQALFDEIGTTPAHESSILPCVTHALNCLSQADWTNITPADIGAEVDTELVDELIDFLDIQAR